MKKKLVLVGAMFGREIQFHFSESNLSSTHDIIGFVDNDKKLIGTNINGIPVLGDDDWLLKYPEPVAVLVCIGNPSLKKRIVERLKGSSLISFPSMISNDVAYSETVIIGEGCTICRACVLTVNLTIGDFVLINLNCTIGHDDRIGNYVNINPGVNISGNVIIEDCVEIGVGSQIIPGKKIGSGTIIGAGSVVVSDIPANCTAVGVPAKPIKYHSSNEVSLT